MVFDLIGVSKLWSAEWKLNKAIYQSEKQSMDTIYTEFNSSLLTQGKLGKTHHMQQRTWMLGGCVEEWHIPQVSEGATNCNQRMTEQFTSGRLGDISDGMSHSSTCSSNIQVYHCTL